MVIFPVVVESESPELRSMVSLPGRFLPPKMKMAWAAALDE